MTTLSRAQFVSRAAAGGALVLAGATGAGALAGSAAAAALPDNDLAWLRLLVVTELLGADFYANAQKAQPYGKPGMDLLARAAFNEGEHYTSVAGILTGAGQTHSTADDVDFSYPAATFKTVAGVTKAAVDLETLFLGAYLGAIGGIQNPDVKQPLAQIAANQAEHLALFTQLLGRRPLELSFPAALAIDAASDALDAYTS